MHALPRSHPERRQPRERGEVDLVVGPARKDLLEGDARLEARIAFEEILARWPDYQIDLASLTRLPSLWVRAWEGVHVALR